MRALLWLLLAPVAAGACPGLELHDGWVRAPLPGADVLAAYGELRNAGASVLRIDGFGADGFGMAMLHETRLENGMSRMRARDALVLAPGKSATLAPGGMHLMLMQPAAALKAGDRAQLRFACSGRESRFAVPVRP
ncbi:MAG TPA: copper chaperone PCu(A)C [Candidatus Binatia bacterium]|nr:copper chaperone PCu(A)C [Candidatus Binatia bacterium]